MGYEIKKERNYFIIVDEHDNFVCSSDTYEEAKRDIEELSNGSMDTLLGCI